MNRILFFLIFTMVLTGCINLTTDANSHNMEYQNLKKEVHLSIPAEDLNELISDYRNSDLKKDVDLIIGSRTLSGTLKIHGGTSRSYPKKSFRLTLNDKVPARLIFDSLFLDDSEHLVQTIVLNAATVDQSRMRNAIAMQITKMAGGKVPQIGFHNLYINDEYYGFYSFVERIDEDFAEKFTENSYDLLKAQGWKAALYEGCEEFEVKHGTSEFLEDFSEELTDDDSKSKEIQKQVDMPSINAFFLGNMITDETDGYGKNYYLLYDHGIDKATFFRWDADASLGRWWDGSKKNSTPFPAERVVKMNALLEKLAEDKKWRTTVHDQAQELYDNGLTDSVLSLIDILEERFTENILADFEKWDTLFYAYLETENRQWFWDFSLSPEERLRSQFDEIREFIINRETSLMEDLESFESDDDHDDDDHDDDDHDDDETHDNVKEDDHDDDESDNEDDHDESDKDKDHDEDESDSDDD